MSKSSCYTTQSEKKKWFRPQVTNDSLKEKHQTSRDTTYMQWYSIGPQNWRQLTRRPNELHKHVTWIYDGCQRRAALYMHLMWYTCEWDWLCEASRSVSGITTARIAGAGWPCRGHCRGSPAARGRSTMWSPSRGGYCTISRTPSPGVQENEVNMSVPWTSSDSDSRHNSKRNWQLNDSNGIKTAKLCQRKHYQLKLFMPNDFYIFTLSYDQLLTTFFKFIVENWLAVEGICLFSHTYQKYSLHVSCLLSL